MTGDGRALLLLDTHFWIWLQKGEANVFTVSIRRAVEAALTAGNLDLSIISVWEVALLQSKGRVELSLSCGQWVQQALAIPGLTLAPLTRNRRRKLQFTETISWRLRRPDHRSHSENPRRATSYPRFEDSRIWPQTPRLAPLIIFFRAMGLPCR